MTTTNTKQLPSLSKDQKTIADSFKTKSAKIRYLASLGWETGQIRRAFNPVIRYQHVRNVLAEPVKNPTETF